MSGLDVVVHPFWPFTFWLAVGFVFSVLLLAAIHHGRQITSLFGVLIAVIIFTRYVPDPALWILGSIAIGSGAAAAFVSIVNRLNQDEALALRAAEIATQRFEFAEEILALLEGERSKGLSS